MRPLAWLAALLPLACSSSTTPPPIESLPVTDTIAAPGLSAPVDVVRDEWGIPHLYGQTLDDVAFAQGYLQAQDRLVQLDLARHVAEGTLAELLGDFEESLIDRDIRMRVHHLGKTAADAFAALQASSSDADRRLVSALGRFAAGVNAFLAAVQRGDVELPPQLAFTYSAKSARPWSEADSLAIGRLLAFEQSFTADGDIARSALDAAGEARFDRSPDPARAARQGIARDLRILGPIDPTYTLPGGWATLAGGMTSASLPTRADNDGDGALALYLADRPAVLGIGLDHLRAPARGSNNWVVGPSLTASGHALLANDPHLSLDNPPTFYLMHLVARGGSRPVNVLGASIPGVPGVVLGINEHVAWGATDSFLDTTDVYREMVVPCPGGSGPCVQFQGRAVPLVPREEKIGVGRYGDIQRTVTVTLYDVPHHGPILPRVTADHRLEPLGSSELSVRYTGHEVTQEVRAIFGIDGARSMQEAVAALDADFTFGGFNWVLADDAGHFGWTEINRVPRRAAGSVPWKVLPGDGSAEWGVDLDARYIPHAYDPPSGFVATANNDPIGVTADDDPLGGAPVVDGAPLYIGAADFDPGTRIGRITKLLTSRSADHKLTLDDLQAIQADAVSEIGELLAPTLVDAARALAEELAQPGAHAELATLALGASADARAQLGPAIQALAAWSFDTPAAVPLGPGEAAPSATELTDGRATTVFNAWLGRFVARALDDELGILGVQVDGTSLERLIVRMCTHPERLATGRSATTGDALLFDDLATPAEESKRQVAAAALLEALGFLTERLGADVDGWRWGRLHTLALEPLLPVDALRVPLASDPDYGAGFPRHGDNGTVDVAAHGLHPTEFGYAEGPQQRLVVELTPRGPVARNTLPGGEVFDPASPHFRDLIELWRRNRTFPVAFLEEDVAASGRREQAAHGQGRVRFQSP